MTLKSSQFFRLLTQVRFGQLVRSPTHIKEGEKTIKYACVLKLIGSRSRPIEGYHMCYSKFIATADYDTVQHLENFELHYFRKK